MSAVVYEVDVDADDGHVQYGVTPKKDLMQSLAEKMGIYGHLPQEEFNKAFDAPVAVDREWGGWPWILTLEHPLFGRVGCADEEDVGSIAALMKYVRDHWGDRERLREGTPWPSPWPANEQTTSIPLD